MIEVTRILRYTYFDSKRMSHDMQAWQLPAMGVHNFGSLTIDSAILMPREVSDNSVLNVVQRIADRILQAELKQGHVVASDLPEARRRVESWVWEALADVTP